MKTRQELLNNILEMAERRGPDPSLEEAYMLTVTEELKTLDTSGQLDRIAAERGVSRTDAMIQLGNERMEPFETVKLQARSEEQDRLKQRISEYAKSHGVSYPEASKKVIGRP